MRRLIATVALLGGALFATPSAAAGMAIINVPGDFSTIQAAIDAADNGDEIVVAPGTYTEYLNFLGKDIVVRSSAGPDVTILEQATSNTPSVTMTSGEPLSATITGFTFTDSPSGAFGYSLFLENGAGTFTDNRVEGIRGVWVKDANVVAARNSFVDTDNPIRIEASDAIFDSNSITGRDTGGIGIYIDEGARPDAVIEITNNYMRNTPVQPLNTVGLDSILVRGNEFAENGRGVIVRGISPIVENNVFALNGLTDNSTSARNEIDFRGTNGGRFINNTVYGEDRLSRKFYFQGPASTIVSNNVFEGPVRNGLVDCSSNITMRANTVWNTKARAFVQGCAVIGKNANKSANPKFVNKAGFDFRLLPTSPVIDDARISDAPATDGDGNPRPLDGDGDGDARADRGAFEYTGSTIRGAVTSAGNPRHLICVTAQTPAGLAVSRTASKANGTYQLTVGPGDYKIYFEDCVDSILLAEWYDNVTSLNAATTVTVGAADDVLGIDIDLLPDLFCDGQQVTIVGTPGDDTIVGTSGPDVIAALGGNDNIKAGKGNDVVCAGDGRDTINGGPGTDLLYGEELKDVFKGSKGLDVIDGGPVDEANVLDLSASPTAVTVKMNKSKVFGWGGRHLVNIGEVIGSRFDDTMIGDANHNTLRGGPGNDFIDPRSGDDWVFGNEGNDTILAGGPSLDRFIVGSAGDDLFIVKDTAALVSIEGGSGVDALVFENPTGPVQVVGQIVRFGKARIDINGMDIIEGTPFADDINLGSHHEAEGRYFAFAGLGDDVLHGAATDQYLDGGVGDDTLISTAAYQTLVGGIGDDHLESQRDGALMAPGPGTNTVQGSTDPDDAVTFELQNSSVVVNLNFGIATWDLGSASLDAIDHAVGTDYNDTLTGNNGENILVGLAGNDTLRGSDGDDVLDGNEGSDFLNGGNGYDFCFNGESHQSCEEIADLERLAFAPAAELANVRHPMIAAIVARHLGLSGVSGWEVTPQ